MSKNHSTRAQDTALSTTGSGLRNLIHWLLAVAVILLFCALVMAVFPNLQADIENLVGGRERARLIGALVVLLSGYMLFRKEK